MNIMLSMIVTQPIHLFTNPETMMTRKREYSNENVVIGGFYCVKNSFRVVVRVLVFDRF